MPQSHRYSFYLNRKGLSHTNNFFDRPSSSSILIWQNRFWDLLVQRVHIIFVKMKLKNSKTVIWSLRNEWQYYKFKYFYINSPLISIFLTRITLTTHIWGKTPLACCSSWPPCFSLGMFPVQYNENRTALMECTNWIVYSNIMSLLNKDNVTVLP